jgi:hypothetical protein
VVLCRISIEALDPRMREERHNLLINLLGAGSALHQCARFLLSSFRAFTVTG